MVDSSGKKRCGHSHSKQLKLLPGRIDFLGLFTVEKFNASELFVRDTQNPDLPIFGEERFDSFPVFLNGTPISAISGDNVEQFPHLRFLPSVEEH